MSKRTDVKPIDLCDDLETILRERPGEWVSPKTLWAELEVRVIN